MKAARERQQFEYTELRASARRFKHHFNGSEYRNAVKIWDASEAFRDHRVQPVSLAIYSGSLALITGSNTQANLRLSLKIGLDIARTQYPARPLTDHERNRVSVSPDGAISYLTPNQIPSATPLISTSNDDIDKSDPTSPPDARPMYRIPKVCYINTLIGEWELDNEMLYAVPEVGAWMSGKRQTGLPWRDIEFESHTMMPGELIRKIDAMRDYIVRDGIDVVIINSFEFACASPKDKNDLVNFLKELRDMHQKTVIVLSHESRSVSAGNATIGPVGGLAMMSMSAAEISVHWRGEYGNNTAEAFLASAQTGIPSHAGISNIEEGTLPVQEKPKAKRTVTPRTFGAAFEDRMQEKLIIGTGDSRDPSSGEHDEDLELVE